MSTLGTSVPSLPGVELSLGHSGARAARRPAWDRCRAGQTPESRKGTAATWYRSS
jgi:hypothetical protein